MGIIENGIYKEVHPCFLYESCATFILFIILVFLQKKKKFRGEITYIYFIIYGLARFFIEGLRSDSLYLGNIRISQIISAILFVTFTIILLKNVVNIRKNRQSSIK